MKVYEKLVIDMRSGEIVEEKSFDYQGPVARCFGSNDPPPTSTSYVQSPEQRQMFQMISPLAAILARAGMAQRLQQPRMYNPGGMFTPQSPMMTNQWWSNPSQGMGFRYGGK